MKLLLAPGNTVVLQPPEEAGPTAQPLAWNVTVFDKTRFSNLADPFKEINAFWEWLQPMRRVRIYNIYKLIHDEVRDTTNSEFLQTRVQELVTQLYAEQPLEEFNHWVHYYGDISYPSNFRTTHDPDDPMPVRTYLISDYQELVVVTLALRVMFPIWGHYMNEIRRNMDSDWKEYYSIALIYNTYIHQTRAIERLRDYIESIISTDLDNTSAILSTLSSAELVDWLLAIIIIRRLSAGDLEAGEGVGNIVTNIHRFVDGTTKDLERKFGKTSEKYGETSSNNIETETSKIEDYRTKEETSIGDSVQFDIYCQNYCHIALHKSDPTAPIEHLQHVLTNEIGSLLASPIQEIQLRFVEWMFTEQISPGGVENLNKQYLVTMMGVSHCLLWHWGFYELAALSTAICKDYDSHFMVMSSGKTGLSEQTLARLNEHYPYLYSNEKDIRKANPVYAAIIDTGGVISRKQWRVTSDISKLRTVGVSCDDNGFLTISHNLIEQLALLVIKIEEMRV